MPCIHCTVYSYDCTYNQPTRSKKRSPQGQAPGPPGSTKSPTISALASSNPELLAKLSDRLKLYDDILHRLLPDIKLTDLNDNPKPINPMKLMAALNKMRENNESDVLKSSSRVSEVYESLPDMPVPYIPTVKMPGARAAGTKPDSSPPTDTEKSAPITLTPSNRTDDSPLGKEVPIILPSREVALDLISKTWGSACVLFRFYHRVAFMEDLNELYDTDPSQYTNKQQRFLPLVYSVLACGALFYKSEQRSSKKNEAGPQKEDVDDEGYRYFTAARKLIDITDTRDTFGIQTIVMLIIFLQCSARLSTCYAYIGIALRAALREGLHRKLDYPFNPIELETRKRLFWTIYKMDIYVNTMLGLPRTILEDDFDQELPIELDDENITVSEYRFDRQGSRLSSSGIANAHTRLMMVMGHVVTTLYPIKGTAALVNPGHDVLSGLEKELQDWMDSLPIELKPGVEPQAQYLKANRLLHIFYLHVKIILYRPYIHYIASGAGAADHVSFEKAQNCIAVARVVVKLSQDMIKRNILSGSYWFSIYTIFFSVACLVYYVHFAPRILPDGTPDPNYESIKEDADKGRQVLEQLKDTSMAARRTYNILYSLFEEMNRIDTHEETDKQFNTPHTPKEQKFTNNQITNIVNGVNFIDGVSTGVNLKDTSDFTVNYPTEPTSPINSQYMPGPMDQLDMRIFGRFLPPYMLNQNEQTVDKRELSPEFLPDDSSVFGTQRPAIPSGLSTVVRAQEETQDRDSINFLYDDLVDDDIYR